MTPETGSAAHRLALGTVQLGLPYGIRNTGARIEEQEAHDILEYAIREGIDTLDTAESYGVSEAVVGKYLRTSGAECRIITKLGALTAERSLRERLEQSLSRLGRSSVYGLLAHDFSDLRARPSSWLQFEELRGDGCVEKIGLSVYHPDEVHWARAQGWSFDLVQLPYNVFDRRFEELMASLDSEGVEIHARSTFLQGLFFCDPAELSVHFAPVRDTLTRLQSIARQLGEALESLLLNFCLSRSDIARVVVGVDSRAQLERNLVAAGNLSALDGTWYEELRALVVTDEAILVPPNWI